jgi:hypothetical protein
MMGIDETFLEVEEVVKSHSAKKLLCCCYSIEEVKRLVIRGAPEYLLLFGKSDKEAPLAVPTAFTSAQTIIGVLGDYSNCRLLIESLRPAPICYDDLADGDKKPDPATLERRQRMLNVN